MIVPADIGLVAYAATADPGSLPSRIIEDPTWRKIFQQNVVKRMGKAGRKTTLLVTCPRGIFCRTCDV